MQKIKFFLFWCLLIGTLASCSKEDSDNEGDPNKASDYYPTTAGSSWNYAGLPAQGVLPHTVSSSGATKVINGKTFNEMEMKIGTAVNKSYISKQDGEYTTIGFVTTPTGTALSDQIEITLIKESAAIGSSWQKDIVVNGINNTLTTTLVATGLTKTVSGKEFKDVIQIKLVTSITFMGQTIAAPATHYFFAKGVGLILTDIETMGQIPLLTYDVK